MGLNIFGAAGCAKEAYFLCKRLGMKVDAFVDKKKGNYIYGVPVVGEHEYVITNPAIVAFGQPDLRERVVKRILEKYEHTSFPSIIDPTAIFIDKDTIRIGKGAIIFAGSIIMCNVHIGDFLQLNLHSTISHDFTCGDFFTTAIGVNIAGNVKIGKNVFFGIGSGCKEKINICDDVKVGLGAAVVKNITEPGIYVGVPAIKLIKQNEGSL